MAAQRLRGMLDAWGKNIEAILGGRSLALWRLKVAAWPQSIHLVQMSFIWVKPAVPQSLTMTV